MLILFPLFSRGRDLDALTSKVGTLSLEAQSKLEKDTAKKEAKAEAKADAEAKKRQVRIMSMGYLRGELMIYDLAGLGNWCCWGMNWITKAAKVSRMSCFWGNCG